MAFPYGGGGFGGGFGEGGYGMPMMGGRCGAVKRLLLFASARRRKRALAVRGAAGSQTSHCSATCRSACTAACH